MAFDLVPRNKAATIPEANKPDPAMMLATICGDKVTLATRRESGAPSFSFCTGNATWNAIWDWVVTTDGIFTDSEKKSGYTNNFLFVTSLQCLLLVKEMERFVAGGGQFIGTFGDGNDGEVRKALPDDFVQEIMTFFRTSGGFEIQ